MGLDFFLDGPHHFLGPKTQEVDDLKNIQDLVDRDDMRESCLLHALDSPFLSIYKEQGVHVILAALFASIPSSSAL